MNRQDEIVARIREIKRERGAAVEERDLALIDLAAARAKLEEVRSLVINDGAGITLTMLPKFLRALRELLD